MSSALFSPNMCTLFLYHKIESYTTTWSPLTPLSRNRYPVSLFLTMDNLNGIRQPSVDEFCCNVEQRLPSNWNCCLIKHWANCICLSISSLWFIIICLSLSYKTQRSNFVQIVGNLSSTSAVEYKWSMITIGYDGFTAAVIVWGLENAWLSTPEASHWVCEDCWLLTVFWDNEPWPKPPDLRVCLSQPELHRALSHWNGLYYPNIGKMS